MNNLIFAIDINAILEDESEIFNVKGFVIDNKRIYKSSDGTILTGSKKIKTIKFSLFVVPAEILPIIMSKENI